MADFLNAIGNIAQSVRPVPKPIKPKMSDVPPELQESLIEELQERLGSDVSKKKIRELLENIEQTLTTTGEENNISTLLQKIQNELSIIQPESPSLGEDIDIEDIDLNIEQDNPEDQIINILQMLEKELTIQTRKNVPEIPLSELSEIFEEEEKEKGIQWPNVPKGITNLTKGIQWPNVPKGIINRIKLPIKSTKPISIEPGETLEEPDTENPEIEEQSIEEPTTKEGIDFIQRVKDYMKTLKPTEEPDPDLEPIAITPHTIRLDGIVYKQLTEPKDISGNVAKDNVSLYLSDSRPKSVVHSIRDVDEMFALLKNNSLGKSIRTDDDLYREYSYEINYNLPPETQTTYSDDQYDVYVQDLLKMIEENLSIGRI